MLHKVYLWIFHINSCLSKILTYLVVEAVGESGASYVLGNVGAAVMDTSRKTCMLL